MELDNKARTGLESCDEVSFRLESLESVATAWTSFLGKCAEVSLGLVSLKLLISLESDAVMPILKSEEFLVELPRQSDSGGDSSLLLWSDCAKMRSFSSARGELRLGADASSLIIETVDSSLLHDVRSITGSTCLMGSVTHFLLVSIITI